tara:strand:+ start:125 stop:910 length:786 start_codon:yes stop_codon:yes gene_type:complete
MPKPQTGKPLPRVRYLESKGARYFKQNANRVDELPDKAARLKDAREAILNELAYVALITELDAEREQAQADANALQAEQRVKDDIAAKVRAFKSAKVGKLEDVNDFFLSTNMGSVVAATGNQSRGGGLPAISAGADAGFVPNGGFCAVTVPQAAADAFTAKHKLSNALQWVSGDKRVFVMRAGLFGRNSVSYAGQSCIVSAPMSRGGHDWVAPMNGAKWLVTPSKTKLEDGELASCPDSLATLLLAGMGVDGPQVDKVVFS